MKMVRVLVSLAALAIMSINLAMGANYTVGGSNGGWDQSTDLPTWASSQTFLEGDYLIFQYTRNHDVTEVSKADFDTCTASNPLQPPHTGGVTAIPLTSAGSRFFICGSGGHCRGGMKLQIDTLAASAPPPSTTTPPLPATPPSVPPPTPSTTPTVPSPPPKSLTPSPSPKHSHSPAPKISPSSPQSKAGAINPTLPPSSVPPPSGSLLPPPAPSSAAKFDVMGALTACSSGFALIIFLNI